MINKKNGSHLRLKSESNDVDESVDDSTTGTLTNTKIIEPSHKLFSLKLQELWEYRDLFYFLIWRDFKTRYAQSILGIGWAVINPVFQMIIFTIVFGNLAKVDSDGVPYAIFSYTALVPWTYFSGAVTEAGNSLIGASAMFTKVYFPRMVIPIAPVLSKLVDFLIAFLILIGMMVWFGYLPSIWTPTLILLVFIMVLTSAGLGMWLTALAVQYRDIRYALTFFVQLLMYASPVVYPANLIPQKYRIFYALNPMTGVIEGFRSALLKTNPMPWDLIGVGAITSIVLFTSGAVFFRYKERFFADVV